MVLCEYDTQPYSNIGRNRAETGQSAMGGKIAGPLAALTAALLFASASSLQAAPAPAAVAAPSVDVDVELVLAMDVSGSIDYQEAELQRKGIADAFLSKEVVQAIQSGSLGRIAVAEVNFSSKAYGVMTVPIGWQVIHDQKTATAFAQQVLAVPHVSGRGTSIADAIELSMRLLEKSTSVRATKKVIDVSGDGPNNAGRPILDARNEALAQGVVINGLPIIDDSTMPDLDKYYSGCVTGGVGSFVIVAKGFPDFARAIRRKLILEISGLQPGERPASGPVIVKVAMTGGAPLRLAQAPSPRPAIPRHLAGVNPPYPAGCDFPMFGGFNFRSGNF
jgi:hypothetical protein